MTQKNSKAKSYTGGKHVSRGVHFEFKILKKKIDLNCVVNFKIFYLMFVFRDG